MKSVVIQYHNILSVCIEDKIYNIHPEQRGDVSIGDRVEVDIIPFCSCGDDMDIELMLVCPNSIPNAMVDCTNKVASITAHQQRYAL